jgi:antirestriction protein ArdC
MATVKTRESKESAEERRAERRKADREWMASAVEALQTSEGWGRWLRTRGSFRSYSLQNQLLIAHQSPRATRVAGFRKWLELGYAVRKGEHGIRIWAPCPPSRKQVERWRKAGAQPESEPRTFYKMVAVFDRSQVEPLPDFPGGVVELEPPHEPLEGDSVSDLLGPLAEFGRSLGVEVTTEYIAGAAAGYFDATARRIVIDNKPERSPNSQVSTLIHEIAHALVRLDRREEDPQLDYAAEEVVVEAVAFTVCAGVGFDTSGEAVPYVAGWGRGAAPESIERYAGLIDRLAGALETALAPAPPGNA